MNHRKTVFVLTIVVAIGIAIYGVIALNKSSEVSTNVAASTPGTVPVGHVSNNSGNVVEDTFSDSVSAFFEGTDTLPYSFTYDPNSIAISTSSINSHTVVNVVDLNTGDKATVSFSYEGARGLSPQEYWDSILKTSCKSCTLATMPFNNPYLLANVAYEDSASSTSDIYAIAATGDRPWLFIASYPYNDLILRNTLATFQVTSEPVSTLKSNGPIEPY